MTQRSRWLERFVRRRGRQGAGTRGADASDAAVLGGDSFEHVLCEPHARAPARANRLTFNHGTVIRLIAQRAFLLFAHLCI